jgi:hypothetical protein
MLTVRDEPRHEMTMDESDAYRPYQPYPSDRSTSRIAAPSQSTWGKTQRTSPFALGLARILPSISALVLVVATWLPWATLQVILVSHGPETPVSSIDLPLTGVNGLRMLLGQSGLSSAHPSVRWLGLLWTILPLFGLLIGLFHLRMRQGSRALTALYGVWLILATVSIAPIVYGVMTTLAPLSCWQTCSPIPVTSRHPELGAWLAIGGLALGWIAFAGLLLARRSPLATVRSGTPARFSGFHLMGAGALIVGAAIWALGLFAIPWATSGCTGLHLSLNHFVRGTCSGIDGWDAFTAGMGSNSWLALLFLEVVPVMGLYVAIDIWLPRLARSTWVLAASWSLLLTVLFICGVNGVQFTIAHPPRFTYDMQGAWDPSLGVIVCALGIVVGGIGTALLARDELSRPR